MRYRILIVEDSPTMRQLLGFALRRIRGAEIVEASDGLDGLRRLGRGVRPRPRRPYMPVMDGLKLIQAVRGGAR